MRTDEFFGIIGDVDDAIIEEAKDLKRKPRGKAVMRWGALAACFVVVAVLSTQVMKKNDTNNKEDFVVEKQTVDSDLSDAPDPIPAPETEELPKDNSLKNTESEHYEHSVQTESVDADIPGVYNENNEEIYREESVTEDTDSIMADAAPVSGGGGGSSLEMYKETVKPDSLTKTASEIFGGAYIDKHGDYVVVITEDTPENRKIIAEELGINVDDTIFQKGEYTLDYLTQLQNKISTAMANGEIPFVVTSAVMETSNRIRVGTTTEDESELDKVRQMDTMGGAIVFKYSTESFEIKQ